MNQPQPPELPLASAALIGAAPKAKAKRNPKQIMTINNRDDRLEICTLLKHLNPARRLAYFRWACAQAIMPGTVDVHPLVAQSTIALAAAARYCDRSNEQLTMDIIQSLTHMWIDYSLDAKACLAQLVAMARGKAKVTFSAAEPSR